MSRSLRRGAAAAGIAVSLFALTACSGNAADQAGTTTEKAAAGAVDLKAAGCPSTVVIQTDWVPEAEHGHLYELLGKDYTVNATKKSVSGPLMSQGKATGVNVEIRAGGPAISYSSVSAQMAKDSSITLGYVGSDENIQLSNQFQTTAVFAPLDVSPFMIMWDPSTYPGVTDFKSLNAALAAKGGKVRYFGASSPYIDWMVNQNILSKSVLDGSYTGAPAGFVAAGGKDAQQGFASAEPYTYQHLIKAWGKPVKYELIKDSGWDPYTSALSVHTDQLKSLNGCLTKLVPVLQHAEADFFANPTQAIDTILDLTAKYKLGFAYDKGTADYSVKTMLADKIVGDGANSAIGDFDPARAAAFFKVAESTFTGQKKTLKAGLKATDLYTNTYIDPSIGLQ